MKAESLVAGDLPGLIDITHKNRPKIAQKSVKVCQTAMCDDVDIHFSRFKDEAQLEEIIALISHDLSEPYSIYVYRYFIQQW